jgi:hypothetical protein
MVEKKVLEEKMTQQEMWTLIKECNNRFKTWDKHTLSEKYPNKKS